MKKIKITYRDLINNTIIDLLNNKKMISIYDIQFKIYNDHKIIVHSQLIRKKMNKKYKIKMIGY